MFALKQTAFMPLLCAVALFCAACDDQNAQKKGSQIAQHQDDAVVTKLHGETMGTYWQVSIADPVADGEEVQRQIEDVLLEVNQDMSTYIPDSAISTFNQRNDSAAQKISAGFMANVLAAREISEASDGSYDITVGPLVNLWGFGPDKVAVAPTQAQIDEALAKVGYQQLLIDEQAGTIAKANPDMKIDLSSIAKGYGVDAVGQRLADLNYQNYLVDIGGELLARGNKKGDPWRVAIEQPVDGRHVQQVIELNDGQGGQTALATSGNYRNFVDYEGTHAVHTIDPRTGHSSQSRLLSVTVIADDCMYADGYATAMMAIGADGAEAFAEKEHLAVLFIYAAKEAGEGFEVVQSTAWRERFGG
ncbi:FAD:protein FMN transferase [Cardiobacteriaceae bacterium TAE3-ERU3]|nr:FAD:protein FMN transferase [Cardiobacteriaceae bacterium TAE3-ERU3]